MGAHAVPVETRPSGARPPCAGLHLPRLDWRLWFLPLRLFVAAKDRWVVRFLEAVREGRPVCHLLRTHLPGCDEVRLVKYEYRFPGDDVGDPAGWERGRWWSRRALEQVYYSLGQNSRPCTTMIGHCDKLSDK